MTTKRHMPSLTMDEVLLLVDAYHEIQGKTRIERRKIEEELSKAMKALPFFPEFREYESFRSYNGMDMLMNNIIYHEMKKNYKFVHITEKEKSVLEYYKNSRELLHNYVKTIKELSKLNFPIVDIFSESIMGSMIPSYHVFLEKNNQIIKKTLHEAILQHRTKCRLCGVELADLYGAYNKFLIEIHIDLPLEENNLSLNPSPSELILICPTCHKLAHSEPRFFDSKNLYKVIKG